MGFFKKLKSLPLLSLISLIILFSFSKPITELIYWDNYFAVTDDYAQIIGWTTKNIPVDSKILIYPNDYHLHRLEYDFYIYNTYDLITELNEAKISYTFQDDDLYKWRADENLYQNIKLLYREDGHKNVILLHDENSKGNLSIIKDFVASQANGTISFYLKIDEVNENKDTGINIRIFGDNFSEGIDFYLNYGEYFCYNESNNGYDKLSNSYSSNMWNYYKIYFQCNNTSGYWNLSINDVQVINTLSGEAKLEYRGDPNTLNKIQICTTIQGADYRVYLDDFNYNWENIISERILLNDISKLIYHLIQNNINYLIIKNQYVSEYQELLDYFYRTKLYEYGIFSIYGYESI